MESVQYILCQWPALQNRSHQFLDERMFKDLGMAANVLLTEVGGLSRAGGESNPLPMDHENGIYPTA